MSKIKTVPLIPIRDEILLPGMRKRYHLGRERTVNAVKAAAASDGLVMLGFQNDPEVEMPEQADLYTYGCLAEITILRPSEIEDGVMTVMCGALTRAQIKEVHLVDSFQNATIEVLDTRNSAYAELERLLKDFKWLLFLQGRTQWEDLERGAPTDPIELVTMISVFFLSPYLPFEDQREFLSVTDLSEQIKFLQGRLTKRLTVLEKGGLEDKSLEGGLYYNIYTVEKEQDDDGEVAHAVLIDERTPERISNTPELSVLVALLRIAHARSQARGPRPGDVIFEFTEIPPDFLVSVILSVGARIRLKADSLASAPPAAQAIHRDVEARDLAQRVDESFRAFADTVTSELGLSYLEALETLEQKRSKFVGGVLSIDYCHFMLALAALAGEVVRESVGGSWRVEEDGGIPFVTGDDDEKRNYFIKIVERRFWDESDHCVLPAVFTVISPPNISKGLLLPCFKRSDWPGHEHCIRLTTAFEELPAELCAVLARDTETAIGYPYAEGLSKEQLDEMAEEAFNNLCALEVEIVYREEPGKQRAVVRGSAFAAEKILDRSFIQEFCERWGTDTLYAAVPCRGTLILASSSDEGGVAGMVQACQGDYANSKDAGIDLFSELAFELRNGQIVGVAQPAEH